MIHNNGHFWIKHVAKRPTVLAILTKRVHTSAGQLGCGLKQGRNSSGPVLPPDYPGKPHVQLTQ